ALAGADHVVPVAEMASLLSRLVRRPADARENATMADPIERMPGMVNDDMAAQEHGRRRGEPSVFSCPECSGVLWQIDDHKLIRYRCHVGHAYYAEQLLEGQAEALEAALWSAVRIFRERATLSRQLALQERNLGHKASAERFLEQAEQSEQQGIAIHQHL